MSRGDALIAAVNPSFPRVSGDEPMVPGRLIRYQTFSPRERG